MVKVHEIQKLYLSGKRRRRDIPTTSEVAASLQALATRFQKEESKNLKRFAHLVCLNLEQTSAYITAAATSTISFAKKITKLNNVVAQITGDYIIVEGCRIVDDYNFLPINVSCGLRIPILYNFNGEYNILEDEPYKKHHGFMDPRTRQIFDVQIPSNCETASELIVDFDSPVIVNGKAGSIHDFIAKEYQLYNAFENTFIISDLVIPELHGLEFKLISNQRNIEEYMDFLENLKKGFDTIGKLGNKEVSKVDTDVQQVIKGVIKGGFLWLFAPNFDDPLIRILVLIASAMSIFMFITQFILPFTMHNFILKNLGKERVIERGKLFSKLNENETMFK